jgi:hypothetical protein
MIAMTVTPPRTALTVAATISKRRAHRIRSKSGQVMLRFPMQLSSSIFS